MGEGLFQPIHLLIIFAILLLLFGGRKIPEVMKGLGEGIRSFKDGMASGTGTTATPGRVSAPAGLTAKAGKGEVSLNWSAAPGAITYNVMRSGTSGGPYARIASVAVPGYSDEGLASGTTFYYAVSSTNSSGESENSMEVSATPA
jgi:TatA/E family protein of Tat protein translocase